jgi:hypothetical protein
MMKTKTILAFCMWLTLLSGAWGSVPDSTQVMHTERWEFPIELRYYPSAYSSTTLSVNVNYRLLSRVWIGMGAGADLNSNLITLFDSSINIPVYGTLQVFPFKGKYTQFFVYGNAGYSFWGCSFKMDGDDVVRKNSGVIGEIGLGWHSPFGRRVGANCHIGYSVRRVDFADGGVYYLNGRKYVDDDSFWRKTISIGVGVVF